ncbi:MAG: DUF2807 domain-containing protein [Pseudomonadota bacterium]
MRKLIAAGLVLGAFALAIAHAEPRSAGQFSSINARGQFRVEVVAGPQSVDVSGPDANRIAVHTEGGELVLSLVNPPWFGREPHLDAVVHVSTPRLEHLRASRGASVHAVDVRADAFDAAASMGGELEVAGVCRQLDADASMGGVVNAASLTCASVHADASMGGVISASAHQSAEGSASMGGTIAFSGNPAQRNRHAIMGGDVHFD